MGCSSLKFRWAEPHPAGVQGDPRPDEMGLAPMLVTQGLDHGMRTCQSPGAMLGSQQSLV
jgi:hypothetical protein